MTFKDDKLEEFMSLFRSVKGLIASSPGCNSLKIYSDISDKSVIFTYSEWSSEEDLNKYRNSTLFKTTWSQTKKLFKAAPEASSMSNVETE